MSPKRDPHSVSGGFSGVERSALAHAPTDNITLRRPAEWTCPICRRPAHRRIPAALSPFLMERCRLNVRTAAFSHFCVDCEHVFFTPVLDEAALDLLYEDYRGPRYTEERIRFEPHYGECASALSDIDSHYYDVRREFYDEFLYELRLIDGVVTDLGGGNGFFSRYVFPNADVVILERDHLACGIDPAELLAATAFLFCSYVLQTSPDPLALLASHVRYLRVGTPVWVEIPKPYPGSLEASFLLEEARSRRNAPPGPLRLMHENLNHFSLRSARKVAETAGVRIREIIRSDIGIIGLLGDKI